MNPVLVALDVDSAAKALPTAPVPRPPQPIRPSFKVSLPAACAARLINRLVAAAPASAALDCLKNVRRELAPGVEAWESAIA